MNPDLGAVNFKTAHYRFLKPDKPSDRTLYLNRHFQI
jgi:hypothetical protein